MDRDFEEYEREYLKRLAMDKPAPAESYRQRAARLHEELVESAKKEARNTELGSWDYAILFMIRRGDLGAPMKTGTLRYHESLLRLHSHGLVTRLGRRLTFDETERLQAFIDSPAYRQYRDRLKRIMTVEVAGRIALVTEILGTGNAPYLMELTDAGTEALNAKRAEAAELYGKMAMQHTKDRTAFYKDMPSYEGMLPVFFAMGMTGPVMAAMLVSSDIQYNAYDQPGIAEIDLGADGFGLELG